MRLRKRTPGSWKRVPEAVVKVAGEAPVVLLCEEPLARSPYVLPGGRLALLDALSAGRLAGLLRRLASGLEAVGQAARAARPRMPA